MIIPLQAKLIAGAVGLALAFGGGYTVRGWKADSEKLEEVSLTQAAIDIQRKLYDTAALGYEDTRAALDRQAYDTQTIIRETFREIPVPAECAVPDAVADSLRASVEATNRAASGQPPGEMPAAAPAANPAD